MPEGQGKPALITADTAAVKNEIMLRFWLLNAKSKRHTAVCHKHVPQFALPM